jgi:hypothetical protein
MAAYVFCPHNKISRTFKSAVRYIKGLVAVATLFISFVFFNTCISNHIHTMIQYIHPSPVAEASLHFLIALVLSGEKPPWGAEPRFELGPAVLTVKIKKYNYGK